MNNTNLSQGKERKTMSLLTTCCPPFKGAVVIMMLFVPWKDTAVYSKHASSHETKKREREDLNLPFMSLLVVANVNSE